MYSDSVGSFYIDEYGHQNYITDYGAKFYHVNCEGQFVLVGKTYIHPSKYTHYSFKTAQVLSPL